MSKKIFVTVPLGEDFTDVHHAIVKAGKIAAQNLGTEVTILHPDIVSYKSATQETIKCVDEADLVIADVSTGFCNVMFDLGIVESRNKALILILQDGQAPPFKVAAHRMNHYQRDKLFEKLVPQLAEQISICLLNPDQFQINNLSKTPSKPMVFISYSHRDEDYLKRLKVHAKPLEKKEVVQFWSDIEIKTGDKWQEQISSALDNSAIAILLISADFLASDFVIDKELPPLLHAAETKGTRILPVVLKPCRFLREESLANFQSLNPPDTPILSMQENEQEYWWDKLMEEIEKELH